MTIDDVIGRVLANEGGYVNDPHDAGGETNFGITAKVARQQGYAGPMRTMPRAFAIEVYRRQYVVASGFDKVAALSMPIAAELIDTGVNMGPATATAFLQRALNVLNRGGKDYPDLKLDCGCGPTTVAALRAFLTLRGAEGERRLLRLLNSLQDARYAELAEARATNEDFMFGWLGRAA